MVESTTQVPDTSSPSNKENVRQPAEAQTDGNITADTTPEESKEQGANTIQKGPEVKQIPSVDNPVDLERLEHQRKCKVFNEWCAKNGIEYPNQEYPAYFDGGLVGVRALAPIEHRDAFLKVPFKCIMSIDKAQNHPELGKVISENPELFGEDECQDWEQLILFIFVLYEYQKGEDSFWKPYLDLMPHVEFFCDWKEDDIFAVQDYGLIFGAMEYKEELTREYNAICMVLSKYPDIFTQKSMSRAAFTRFYGQICTRCFGWGLPFTAMVPMADNYNHSDVTTVQEIIHKQQQMEADETSKYFCKTKFMNNYTFMFKDELAALDKEDSKESK